LLLFLSHRLQQALLVVIALAAYKIPGASLQNLTVGQVQKCCTGSLLQKLCLPTVASSEFADVFSALEASGLVGVDSSSGKSRPGLGKTTKSTKNATGIMGGGVSLGICGYPTNSPLWIKITYEELTDALQDDPLFTSLFSQIQ